MCNKILYTSLRDASTAINYAKKISHTNRNRKLPVRAYYCEECSGYHLTSKVYKGDNEYKSK